MNSVHSAIIACLETMTHVLFIIRKKDTAHKYLLIEHRKINRKEN